MFCSAAWSGIFCKFLDSTTSTVLQPPKGIAYFAFGAAAAAAQGKLANDTGPSWTILMTLIAATSAAAATVLLLYSTAVSIHADPSIRLAGAAPRCDGEHQTCTYSGQNGSYGACERAKMDLEKACGADALVCVDC